MNIKSIKAAILAFATLTVVGLGAAAHASHHGGKMGHASPEERAARQTAHMTEALGLSPEQAEEVGAINRKYAAKAQEARKDAASREDRHGAMREMMGQRDEELRAVLDDEQYARLQEMRKAMHELRRQGGEKAAN